jgi:hypothetical protein
MTVNNYDENKASKNWIDAYKSGSYSDIEKLDNFSSQFLSQANDPSIDVEHLIGTLCVNNFSALAISSMAEVGDPGNNVEGQEMTEVIPVLSIILHPFKELNLTDKFGSKESLFAIHTNRADQDNKPIEVIEFINPLEVFSPWKKKPEEEEKSATVSQESKEESAQGQRDEPEPTEDDEEELGIVTPSFADFFDENFIKGKSGEEPYQPLNNATEILPVNTKELVETKKKKKKKGDEAIPKPFYVPRKVIPLTPAMVRIIWKQREHNFSAIINGIREYAWFKVKVFKSMESRKNYLYLIYRTIQALWAHGQQETENSSPMAKFIRCGSKKAHQE